MLIGYMWVLKVDGFQVIDLQCDVLIVVGVDLVYFYEDQVFGMCEDWFGLMSCLKVL